MSITSKCFIISPTSCSKRENNHHHDSFFPDYLLFCQSKSNNLYLCNMGQFDRQNVYIQINKQKQERAQLDVYKNSPTANISSQTLDNFSKCVAQVLSWQTAFYPKSTLPICQLRRHVSHKNFPVFSAYCPHLGRWMEHWTVLPQW